MPYKSPYFSLLVIHILHTSVFTSSLCSVYMEITTTSTSTGAYRKALIQVTENKLLFFFVTRHVANKVFRCLKFILFDRSFRNVYWFVNLLEQAV